MTRRTPLTAEQRDALANVLIENWRDHHLVELDSILDEMLRNGRVGFANYPDVELVERAQEILPAERFAELGIDVADATAPEAVRTIDLRPTWGEMGNLLWRMVASNEQAALASMKSEFARAMASTEALLAIQDTLTEAQRAVVAKTLSAELTKQGY